MERETELLLQYEYYLNKFAATYFNYRIQHF